MKNPFIIAVAGAIMLSGAAFAETSQADIDADKGAIAKDNAAIAKQKSNIAVNRVEKKAAKVKGNPADQASQSVQIGANKAAIDEKTAEKNVDTKILQHDEKEMQEDKMDSK